MSVARPLVTLLAVGTLAACSYGVNTKKFRPALGPQGVEAIVETDPGEERRGELLEVRENGLLLATPRAILLVPYEAARSARFVDVNIRLSRRAPTPEEFDRLRLLSRFPQGLDPVLLRQLLEARGQSEPRTLR
jgi:hypothetical protein